MTTLRLIDALRSKRIAGAGLDVLEGEPSVRWAQCRDFPKVTLPLSSHGGRFPARLDGLADWGDILVIPTMTLRGEPHG